MKQTHVAHALLAVTSDSSIRALAAGCGISPSTLSKTISEGRRLDEATLRKLCAQSKGVHILVAHLHDEIDRAGRLQTEVRVEADDVEIENDLRFLVERSRHDNSLASILRELADLARKVQRNEALGMVYPLSELPQPRVAEERPEGCAESGEKKAEDGAPV